MSLWMPELTLTVFVPVLALDVSQVIALIVFTVSVLSWIVNVVQGNQPNGAPRPQNRPRDPAQSELEKFLQEVVGGKGQAEQNRPTPPAVPQQKSSRSPNEKKSGKSKQQRPAKSGSGSLRSNDLSGQSNLSTMPLEGGVRSQHLQSTMEAGRINAAVQRDIDGAVLQDLGADRSRETGERANVPHPILVALRSPGGVRQAILLNEVLSKPKGLR